MLAATTAAFPRDGGCRPRSVTIAFFRIFLAVLVTAGGVAHASCDPDEIVIKFSHVVSPTGHPKGEAATRLAALVNIRMNGRVCMEVFPNSILYDDDAAVAAVLDGKVQMVAPTPSKLESYTRRLRIFDMPFLFRSNEALLRFQESVAGLELLRSVEDEGLLGLAFWNDGLKQMSADRPLLLPSDAKGLTFRIQPSEILEAQFEALGASSKRMAFKDVYAGLVSGAIDGQENTWSNISTKWLYEEQDGVTETNHGTLLYVVLVAKDFWESMPDKERSELELILELVTLEGNRLSDRINRQNRQRIIDSGGIVRTLTEEQRRTWQIAMQPVWDRFRDDIGADLIEAARQSGWH